MIEKGCSISEDLPALSMHETPPLLLLLLGMLPVPFRETGTGRRLRAPGSEEGPGGFGTGSSGTGQNPRTGRRARLELGDPEAKETVESEGRGGVR